MVFDMTSPENATKSLAEFAKTTNLQIHNLLFNNNHDVHETICEMVKQTIDTNGIQDIKIAALHYTSNDDNCESIKQVGLRDLQFVLENETPLSKFLNDHSFHFDLSSMKMTYGSEIFDIQYKSGVSPIESPINLISNKIYYDYATTAFIYSKNFTKYGGKVHRRPEFLYNLDRIAKHNMALNSLSQEWVDRSKSYEIKFFAPINIIDECTYDRKPVENWLVNTAVQIIEGISSEVFLYIKRESYVAPEYIASINELI